MVKPIKEIYHLSTKVLGQGNYGCVVKASLKTNKKVVRACKIIPKSKVKDLSRLQTELEILKKLDHPNIVKLYEWYEDQKCFFLIMELLSGGALFERVVAQGYLNESEARTVFQSIIRAVNYCHKCNIVHRDLKPENFMTITKDSLEIKLIDFGLAKNYKIDNNVLSTRAGTPYYIAPEVLNGSYNFKCDIWSMGIILYILICGYPPFLGQTDVEILKKVKSGKYSYEGEEWSTVSDEVKNLIDTCLNIDPEKRPVAEKLIDHPWFKDNSNHVVKLGQEKKFLKSYMEFSKFKRLIYTYLAMISSETELKDLKKFFEEVDMNGDGKLNREEMRRGFKKMGYSDTEDMDNVFDSIDMDKSGMVEYTEFLAAMMDHRKYDQNGERMKMAFQLFDADESGFIEREELKRLLGHNNEEAIDYILNSLDNNKDGKVSYEEFLGLMMGESFNK